MANKRISSEDSPASRSRVELELLEALLLADVPYPWNPAAPESETYLIALEEAFGFEDWAVEEVSTQAQALYAHTNFLFG